MFVVTKVNVYLSAADEDQIVPKCFENLSDSSLMERDVYFILFYFIFH